MAKRRLTECTEDGEYWYDEKAAQKVVRFFKNYLKHVKGQFAGQPFELTKWQKERIIEPLFGWKREDGTRRYRTVYVEVPKKNGKSTLAGGLGLYLTTADGEAGAEVYSAAGDKDQAAIVFELAAQMREQSPKLKKRTIKYRYSIVNPAHASAYKVISSDAFTKHGYNPSAILFDELHVQPNRDLWDTLTTGTISRAQPVTFAMSTAGFDRNSICWEQHDYATKILLGEIRDDSFLPVIYPPPPPRDKENEELDWTDPAVWKAANPNLGVSITMERLRSACKKAQQIPAFENTFRRLHLDEWTQQSSRWIQMRVWDETAGVVDIGAMEGMPCWAGLDLASSVDIAALVLCFEVNNIYKWLPFFWIPKARMADRIKKDRVPYDLWVKQGLVKATEGNVIDHAVIREDILKLRESFDIKEIAFDRWGAVEITQALKGEGLTMVPFGQGFYSMAGPTKELNKLLLQKRLHHGSNPVLRWMAGNVVVETDAAGNLKPNKAKSTARIDGIVAGIMALDRAMRKGGEEKSVYEEHGLRTL